MKKRWMGVLLLGFLLLFSPSFGEHNPVQYRIFMVGNGDYFYKSDLKGPAQDIKRLKQVFERAQYGPNNIKPHLKQVQNVPKEVLLSEMANFLKEADENDVSIFYYTGHGAYDGFREEAYLIMVDANRDPARNVSARELERALDAVKGTKIIFLDACQSGGMIRRGEGVEDAEASSEADLFNRAFLETFGENTEKITARSLNKTGYKIITAAAKEESAYEFYMYGIGYGGEFSNYFVKALGYLGTYEANQNGDDKIDFRELYTYLSKKVRHSHVQVYPYFDTTEVYGLTTKIPLERFSLKQKILFVRAGEKKELPAFYWPDNATEKELMGTSEDDAIAKFEAGQVVGFKKGFTKITLQSVGLSQKEDLLVVVQDTLLPMSFWQQETKIYKEMPQIKIRFNKPLSLEKNAVLVLNEKGEAIKISKKIEGEVLFVQSASFLPQQDYYLIIGEDVAGEAGQKLKKGKVYVFRIQP